MGDFRYTAFISYSHTDEAEARRTQRAIENYRIPARIVKTNRLASNRLGRAFRDRSDLASSDDLNTSIRSALNESEYLVVLCSPSAYTSKYVDSEIEHFLEVRGAQNILCLIVDGEPEQIIPERIRLTNREPLAADMRSEADGSAAHLKIIAGMLQVSYDDLRRRQQARQNRRLALITTISVAATAVMALLTFSAIEARNEADLQRSAATQTADFLVGLFSVVDPSEARGNTVTAREILDQGAEQIERDLVDQPEVQARLMKTMGSAYRSLGLYQPAGRLVETALGIQTSRFGMRHPDVVQTTAALAQIRLLEGEFKAAEKLFLKSIELQQGIDPDDKLHLAVLKAGLGSVLGQLGLYVEARPLFEEALALRRAESGGVSELVANSLEELGLNLFELGELENAERYLREAVEMYALVYGEEPLPLRAEAINNLGYVLHGRGKVAEAGAYFQQSLEMNRILLGDAHPSLAVDMSNVAYILREQGRYDEALRYQMDVIAMNRELLGEKHPELAGNLLNLAFIEYDKGDTAGGLNTLVDSVEMYRKVFPDGHPDLAGALTNLGGWLMDGGDFVAAEAYLQEGLSMQRGLLGDDHLRVAFSLVAMAKLYLVTDRFDQARDFSFKAGALFVANFSEEHWRVAWARGIEGAAHLELGDYEIAEQLLQDSYKVLSSDPNARASAITFLERYVDELDSVTTNP